VDDRPVPAYTGRGGALSNGSTSQARVSTGGNARRRSLSVSKHSKGNGNHGSILHFGRYYILRMVEE
jgi:hypothetical protein